MQVTSTNGTSSTNATSSAAKEGLSGISGADFMQVLIKQLQMQDPMQPMTNQEMVQQMSTIRQLEMNTQLTSSLSTLTDQQRFGAAASLIGKEVKGVVADADGNETTLNGVVTSVRFSENGEAILELDSGQALPLAKLVEVKNVDGTTSATAKTTGGSTTAKAAVAA
jgi:flagellar basal-body rod modification protein FlgD